MSLWGSIKTSVEKICSYNAISKIYIVFKKVGNKSPTHADILVDIDIWPNCYKVNINLFSE